MNRLEFERILNKYVNLTLAEIKAEAEKPDTPAIEVVVAKVIAEAIKRGDEKRLEFLLNRLIGPVKIILQVEDLSDADITAEAQRRGLALLQGGKGSEAPAIRPEQIPELIKVARGQS